MTLDTLARQTTTDLILEALQRFGPLAEREIGDMLDEPWQSTNAALDTLICQRRIHIPHTPGRPVVLFAAGPAGVH